MTKDTTITFRSNKELVKNAREISTYSKDFFTLYGSGKDLDITEPEELDILLDGDNFSLSSISQKLEVVNWCE